MALRDLDRLVWALTDLLSTRFTDPSDVEEAAQGLCRDVLDLVEGHAAALLGVGARNAPTVLAASDPTAAAAVDALIALPRSNLSGSDTAAAVVGGTPQGGDALNGDPADVEAERKVLGDLGLQRSIVLPLTDRAQRIGLLWVGTREGQVWTAQDMAALTMLGRAAAGWVRTLRTVQNLSGRTADLDRALHRRLPIEQAKGLLAAAEEIPVAAAFDVIRRRARTQRRTVFDVAVDLVADADASTVKPDAPSGPDQGQNG